MPSLRVISPKVALDVEIEAGHALSIGRHIGNSLPIPDTEISRRHAQIFPRDGQVLISDLGSRNGVYVNGRKTKEAPLAPGDEITLGMSLLFYNPPKNSNCSDLLSSRGKHLWEKLPSYNRFEPFAVTTFSRVELDEMVAKWLERSSNMPQIPVSFLSRSLEFALSLDQPATAAKLCQATSDFLRARIGAERMVIMRSDPKKKELIAQYLFEANQAEDFEVAKDALRIVVDAEQSIFSADCSADFRFERMFKQTHEICGTFLAVPIFTHDAYYGFIYMDQPPGAQPYDFRAMIQTYLAGALLGKCIYWYGATHSEKKSHSSNR